jgi:hypothetical protein
MQKVFVVFLAVKSNMIKLASAAIDAICGYFVRAIVEFRGVIKIPVERLMI